jgi:hypothetical protein
LGLKLTIDRLRLITNKHMRNNKTQKHYRNRQFAECEKH